jgi:hypothetical protein
MLFEALLRSPVAIVSRVVDATYVKEGCLNRRDGAVSQLSDAKVRENCPVAEGCVSKLALAPM